LFLSESVTYGKEKFKASDKNTPDRQRNSKSKKNKRPSLEGNVSQIIQEPAERGARRAPTRIVRPCTGQAEKLSYQESLGGPPSTK